MRAGIAIIIAAAACHHGATPPPPPTCEEAAGHVQSLLPRTFAADEVRIVFATRCREDAWTADVRGCVMGTTSLKDPKHCKAKLPPRARDRLDGDLEQLAVSEARRRVPAACREYAHAVDSLMTCDKIPQAARDSIRASFETQRQAWSAGGSDASVEGCRPAAEAIKQAAASVGCPML